MRSVTGLCALLVATVTGCTAKPVVAPPRPRPIVRPRVLPPLTTDEMQRNVVGAARLNRQCLDADAESGLYVIRLLIEPSGEVSSATPRQAPSRAFDPAAYSGVARYLDRGPAPDNAVTRCLAAALQKLRFRPFGGPTVGFDYPVVVDKQPPSEAQAKDRRCEQDADCTFRPPHPCGCPPCGKTWRRAISRKVLDKQKKRSKRRRRNRCAKRRRKCKPCSESGALRGKRALCLDGQCSVR